MLPDQDDLREQCLLASLPDGAVEWRGYEPTHERVSISDKGLTVTLDLDMLELLELARANGCVVGTFTLSEIAAIAADRQASSYVDHSAALNQIHAMLTGQDTQAGPMPEGALSSVSDTVQRVEYLVGSLRALAPA